MKTSDQFIWLCLSCGRRVPRRVDECRCGFHRPADTVEVNELLAKTYRTKVLLSVTAGLLMAVGAFSARSLLSPAPAEALPVTVEATTDLAPIDVEPVPSIYIPPMPELELETAAPAPSARVAADTSPTPMSAAVPTPIAPPVAAPSQSDQLRVRGEQAYRSAMSAAQRHAGQVDDLWNRYAPTCVAQGATTGNRPWLAALEPSGITLTALRSARRADGKSTNCQRWLDDIVKYANHVRGEVTKATEHARQSGVYPGVVRDVRRESRLEWSGW